MGGTIVIIEDSDEDAFFIKRCLKDYVPADTGLLHFSTMADAESHLGEDKNSVQLLLLDLGLPDTADAQDSFRHIKRFTPDFPVVILTGLENHDMASALIRDGAEDFVNKNLLYDRPELLRNAVDFAIRRHELLKDLRQNAREALAEKEQVISWISGAYSVQP